MLSLSIFVLGILDETLDTPIEIEAGTGVTVGEARRCKAQVVEKRSDIAATLASNTTVDMRDLLTDLQQQQEERRKKQEEETVVEGNKCYLYYLISDALQQ